MQQAYERTKEREEVKDLGQQAKRVTHTLSENVRSNEAASAVGVTWVGKTTTIIMKIGYLLEMKVFIRPELRR